MVYNDAMPPQNQMTPEQQPITNNDSVKTKPHIVQIVALLAIGLVVLAGVGILLLRPVCEGDECTENQDDQSGLAIKQPIASEGKIFGLNYLNFLTGHDENLEIAKFQERFDIGKARYDIVLDEYDSFAEIDAVMDAIDDDVWLMATVRTSRRFAPYPSNFDQYQERLKELALRYKDDVDVWQIENEVYIYSDRWQGTKEQYTYMLNQAYDAIKEAVPDVAVAPAGYGTTLLSANEVPPDLPNPGELPDFVAMPGPEVEGLQRESPASFFAYVLKYGRFDDVVDIHIFDSPEAINVQVQWLKRQLETYSINAQVVVSETASVDRLLAAPSRSLEDLREQQAQELVRRYVYLAENNVIGGMWLHMINPTNQEATSDAFVTGPGRLRLPAYYAFLQLKDSIDGYTEVEKLRDGQYRFRVGDQDVFVIWGLPGETTDLSEYTDAVSAAAFEVVTKLNSALQPIYPPDEVISVKNVPLDRDPLIVRVDNYFEDGQFLPSDNQ